MRNTENCPACPAGLVCLTEEVVTIRYYRCRRCRHKSVTLMWSNPNPSHRICLELYYGVTGEFICLKKRFGGERAVREVPYCALCAKSLEEQISAGVVKPGDVTGSSGTRWPIIFLEKSKK